MVHLVDIYSDISRSEPYSPKKFAYYNGLFHVEPILSISVGAIWLEAYMVWGLYRLGHIWLSSLIYSTLRLPRALLLRKYGFVEAAMKPGILLYPRQCKINWFPQALLPRKSGHVDDIFNAWKVHTHFLSRLLNLYHVFSRK